MRLLIAVLGAGLVALTVFAFAGDGETRSSYTSESETPLPTPSAEATQVVPTPSPSPSPEATAVPTPTPEPPTLPVVPDPAELYVADADGDSVTLLNSGTGHPTAPSWSPDGKRVAFGVRIGADKSELHVVTPSDRSQEVVLDVGGSVGRPLWSPDGKRIAVQHSVEGRWVLQVVPYDGSEGKEFITGTGPDDGFGVVGWLSDQKLLATRSKGQGSALLEVDADSGEWREVQELPGVSYYRGISTDRTRVALIVEKSGLWVVDLSSGRARQVVQDTRVLSALAWSPDDAEIAFGVVDQVGQESGIYVVNVASGDTRRLTNSQYVTEVVWLPDGSGVLGRRISCYGCSPGPPSLVLAPAAGGPEQVILAGAEFGLSPDARSVVFAKDGVHVSSLAGDQLRTLLAADPDWQYAYFNWSPDGRQVAFMRFHGYGIRQFEVNIDGTDLTQLPTSIGRTFPT